MQSAGQIADLGGGGLMAAFGILAALHERERSGEGQLVDVSMTDGALSLAGDGGRRSSCCDGHVPRRGDGDAERRRRLLPAVRVRRRLGHAAARWSRSSGRRSATGSSARTCSSTSSQRRARTGHAAVAEVFRGRDEGRVGGVQRRARLLHRAGARPRRGARLRARPRARDGGRGRPARARARCACSGIR